MGFRGTIGATYIDYLVTDEFVSPLQYAYIYSEKIVHFPLCYLVDDYKQKNQDTLDPNYQPKRSDYGLPKDKFLFARFNQFYKMESEIFNAWCSIPKRVPNSAFWLLKFLAVGEMKSGHSRRCSLADLFLDTPLCNAHTTGADTTCDSTASLASRHYHQPLHRLEPIQYIPYPSSIPFHLGCQLPPS